LTIRKALKDKQMNVLFDDNILTSRQKGKTLLGKFELAYNQSNLLKRLYRGFHQGFVTQNQDELVAEILEQNRLKVRSYYSLANV